VFFRGKSAFDPVHQRVRRK